MFKRLCFMLSGSLLAVTATASSIQSPVDEDVSMSRSWDSDKSWSTPSKVYNLKKYTIVKKTPVKQLKTVVPLKPVPAPPPPPAPKPVPFPARIAPPTGSKYPWSFSGSVGYSGFSQAGDNSGGAVVGRFSIGKALFVRDRNMFGLELGVQNGNRMSISASQETLDEMGSLPIWTTSKPMLDLLATAQVGLPKYNSFLVLKGGVAYRTWETERQSINNLSQVAGEVQAGIGMHIVEKATLSLLYQGVFGGNNNFTVYEDHSATVSNIPMQNGVLLTLSILL